MMRLSASPCDTATRLGLDVNGIMWCDATINPGLYGCAKVSPACTFCYAEDMAARIVRMGGPAAALYREGVNAEGRWTGRVSVHPDRIEAAFAKLPKRPGSKVRRVFVTSMSDLFHKDVPFDFLDGVFCEMFKRPHIDFLVLTKRPSRMAEYAADRILQWPANIWAGTTVEDQRRADERIPDLLRVPAAVRFLSVEPMLGAIRLDKLWCHNCDTDEHVRIDDVPGTNRTQPWCVECDSEVGPAGWLDACADASQAGINWVIIGSESAGNAPGPRETRPEWVLDLVDQCDAAHVPVFVKQLDIGGQLCALPLVNGTVRADFPEVPRG